MKRGYSLLLFLALAGLLAACTSSDKVTIINKTSYAFCKMERTPNLSIYAPWQKNTQRIHLPPGETAFLSGGDKEHVLRLRTCDGRYYVSNFRFRPEPGEPWILTDDMIIDRDIEYHPTPRPTRIPIVLTIVNDAGKDICSLRLALRLKPYKFGDNILAQAMAPGGQIVLTEPEHITWGTYVINVHFCDDDEYITEEVTFEGIMTVRLRGAEPDAHDLLIEKQGVGQ